MWSYPMHHQVISCLGTSVGSRRVLTDRIMQTQRFISSSPLVAHPCLLLDYERRYVKHLQPRRNLEAPLAAPDHDHDWLRLVTGELGFFLAFLGPTAVQWVLLAQRTNLLRESLERFEVAEQRMCLPFGLSAAFRADGHKSKDARAVANFCFKREETWANAQSSSDTEKLRTLTRNPCKVRCRSLEIEPLLVQAKCRQSRSCKIFFQKLLDLLGTVLSVEIPAQTEDISP